MLYILAFCIGIYRIYYKNKSVNETLTIELVGVIEDDDDVVVVVPGGRAVNSEEGMVKVELVYTLGVCVGRYDCGERKT